MIIFVKINSIKAVKVRAKKLSIFLLLLFWLRIKLIVKTFKTSMSLYNSISRVAIPLLFFCLTLLDSHSFNFKEIRIMAEVTKAHPVASYIKLYSRQVVVKTEAKVDYRRTGDVFWVTDSLGENAKFLIWCDIARFLLVDLKTTQRKTISIVWYTKQNFSLSA